jgi:hypothetical protein
MIIPTLLNSLILLSLAFLHIYWASGGKWGREVAVPEHRNGKKVFHPGTGSTLLVAGGLLIFALITLGNYGVFDNMIDSKVVRYGTWAIGIIFLLRSVGDFRFFGFAKRIRHTKFAWYDTHIYSPLALAIALISFALVIWS